MTVRQSVSGSLSESIKFGVFERYPEPDAAPEGILTAIITIAGLLGAVIKMKTRCRHYARLCLALALAFCLTAPCLAGRREQEAERRAVEMYLKTFNVMSQADNFARSGLLDDAAEFYLEAQIGYESLISIYPKWNPDLIAFRSAYCARQLRDIEQGELEAEPWLAPEGAKTTVAYSPDGLLEDLPTNIAMLGVPGSLEKASGLMRKGRARDALAMYEEIILEAPSNLDAVKGAARCCLQLGLLDKGRNMLLTALVTPAADHEAAILLATFHVQLRDHERAIMLMSEVLQKEPKNAHAHLMLGVALLESGRLERAESELQEALDWDPTLGDAHYDLARLNLRKNPPDTKKAKEHYGDALRLGGARDKNIENILKMPN